MHMPRSVVFALIALGLIVIAVLYGSAKLTPPANSVSNQEETSVRAFVEEFGGKFKNVSLLAPDASNQIASEYGAYAAPELLSAWQSGAKVPPGRETSSPWPDRIEIVSVQKLPDETYRVEGNVIEVTSDSLQEPVAVYPITLAVEKKTDGLWTITDVEKGAYSKIPERTSVVGFWECLPHKDTSGPQTLECAFGIAVDPDKHYGVNTMLMARYPVDYPTGTRVRVEGVLVPKEELSADHWQKYLMDGIINATSIEEL